MRACPTTSKTSADFGRRKSADAFKLRPRRTAIVANGIPDPCADFARALLASRRERLATRQKNLVPGAASVAAPTRIAVLYLAHCTREKGLFDALEAVALANE